MFEKILELHAELVARKSLFGYSTPLDLLELLEEPSDQEMANFILAVATRRLNFDFFEPKSCNNALEAFLRLKEAQDTTEKLYYTMKFVSLHSKATSKTIETLLSRIV